MKSRKSTINLSAFFFGSILVMFMWAMTIAQAPPQTLSADEVSDEDLQSFLSINMRMLDLQEKAMQQVEKFIEEQGMTPQRYAEIAAAENNPQGESDATQEELATAKRISDEVQQINQELEKQAQQIIKEEGLTTEKYQAIGTAIENSPELQKKLNEMMQKEIQ